MKTQYKHKAISYIFQQIDSLVQELVEQAAAKLQTQWDKNNDLHKDFFTPRSLTAIEESITSPLAIALWRYLKQDDTIESIHPTTLGGVLTLQCVVVRNGEKYPLHTHIVLADGEINATHLRYRLECKLPSRSPNTYKNYWQKKGAYQGELERYREIVSQTDEVLNLLSSQDWDPDAILACAGCIDAFAYKLHKKNPYTQEQSNQIRERYVNLPDNKKELAKVKRVYVKKRDEYSLKVKKTQEKIAKLESQLRD